MGRLGLASLALAALFAGCGGWGDAPDERADRPERQRTEERPRGEERSPEPRLEPATCPPGAGNCESASGTIIYVERVDPDGDGDAHFVLAGGDVTAPGLSVIDVRADLRPHPLPGPGDRISAAGPVYTGSYGQRQIQADVLHVTGEGD